MKIFARPVQTPIAWFSLSAKLSAQLSPLPVHSTSHEIVFRAPLPYVIVHVNCAKTYIHYNNVDFRHDMRVKLVHAHCFSLVFNKMLIENAPLRLPNASRWMVRRNFKPPTNSHCCLIIDRSLILIIGSNLNRELLLLFLAFHSLRLILNSWMLSVVTLYKKISFSVSRISATVVVNIFWTCSQWKFLSYYLSVWLPFLSRRTLTRRRCS